MKEASVIDKKILNDLKILSPEKKIEVADFIEYLKIRKEDWKKRFKSFLKKSVCSDSDDDRFIECAMEGKADFIVSGDKHLLTLKRYQKVRIISPSAFINYYAQT